jgi:hypothetical protein
MLSRYLPLSSNRLSQPRGQPQNGCLRMSISRCFKQTVPHRLFKVPGKPAGKDEALESGLFCFTGFYDVRARLSYNRTPVALSSSVIVLKTDWKFADQIRL